MRAQTFAIVVSATLLLGSAARAVDIAAYFRMADQDQGRFDNALFVGAKKLLKDEGRQDLADQLDRLFTVVKAGNQLSDGMAEYQARLGAMAVAEAKRQMRNPNLSPLQAEKAFRDAAQDHGISLPPAFDAIASNFRPKFAPKQLPSTPPPRSAPPAPAHPAPSDDDPISSGGFITPPK